MAKKQVQIETPVAPEPLEFWAQEHSDTEILLVLARKVEGGFQGRARVVEIEKLTAIGLGKHYQEMLEDVKADYPDAF